ncbi:MAG: hypothetical protein PGN34_12120 [Methylobacterium frigidaeris]
MIHHRTILALAACAAVLGAGAARAEEQGVFMKNALSSIGLIEPERPTITYRERAPLVLPPKMDKSALPAPVSRGAVRESNANWPVDPETVSRERRSAEARKPITRGEQGRMNDNNTTLSIHEMRAGRREGGGIETTPTYKPGDNVRESTWLNPLALFSGKREEANPSEIEPDRDTLTDPPTGYRKAPAKVARTSSDPVGAPINDRGEADPGAYLRSRQ